MAELAGIVAILFGLYFVYEEIQQNGVIAKAELISQNIQRRSELNEQFRSPVFVNLYLKGIRTPDELDEIERLQLDRYFRERLSLVNFEFYNYKLGLFDEFSQMARSVARNNFLSGYGRAWWNIRRKTHAPAVVKVIDDEIAKHEGFDAHAKFDAEILHEIDSL